MSIIYETRCEWCGVRQPMQQGEQSDWNAHPAGWLVMVEAPKYDPLIMRQNLWRPPTRQFCSWGCVRQYATGIAVLTPQQTSTGVG